MMQTISPLPDTLHELLIYGLTGLGFLSLLLNELLTRSRSSRSISDDALKIDADREHILDFSGDTLVNASQSARRALNEVALGEDGYVHLISRLSQVFQGIQNDFANARRSGSTTELTEVLDKGLVRARIEPNGINARVVIHGLDTPFANQKLVRMSDHKTRENNLARLQAIADTAPMPIWCETSSGEISWANPTYRSLANTIRSDEDAPLPKLFQAGHLGKVGQGSRALRSALTLPNGSAHLFETVSFGVDHGSVHFALDATATAIAEDNLRDFMQSLTNTFAELPIGLAIFDKSRQLVVFNPALMELTQLAPEWLTARPTLYDVLNQLREKRMVPERKDFSDWRKRLVELERSAVEGSFEETWTLPTGQVYRVIGRPHPQGAIAFILEDITSEISRTRQVRQDMRLRDDMLDAMPEAIAAFDSQGALCAANEAFRALWGSDQTGTDADLDIQDMLTIWQANCHPSPVWGDLRDFVFQQKDRAEWTGSVIKLDGRALRGRFTPLTRHITLVSFTEGARDNGLSRRPLAEISHAKLG